MYIRGLDVRRTAPYGLAILRIVLGIAMLVHGWSKLSGGVDNVAGDVVAARVGAAGFVAV